eukprot:scaffold114116_cov28-Tisochrysis_lutea.AAC.2
MATAAARPYRMPRACMRKRIAPSHPLASRRTDGAVRKSAQPRLKGTARHRSCQHRALFGSAMCLPMCARRGASLARAQVHARAGRIVQLPPIQY